MVKKVAILANGGDVSGFNAVIRAIIKTAEFLNPAVLFIFQLQATQSVLPFHRICKNLPISGILHRYDN